MKLTFIIDYYTSACQKLIAHFKIETTEQETQYQTIELHTSDQHTWEGELELPPIALASIYYHYAVYEQGKLLTEEPSEVHHIDLHTSSKVIRHYTIRDQWSALTLPKVYTSSALRHVVYRCEKHLLSPALGTVVFHVTAVPIKGQHLAIVGSCAELGGWEVSQALPLVQRNSYEWEVVLPASTSLLSTQYKYIWRNNHDNTLVAWEEGDNRFTLPFHKQNLASQILLLADGLVRLPQTLWRGAGMVLPLFSIRTTQTFGVGDMTSLATLVRWCASMGMSAVQLLPINDTTDIGTWRESYPYNAVSVFALHPMYLDILAMGELKGKVAIDYQQMQQRLNLLDIVDYEAVNREKWVFIRHQYERNKAKVCHSQDYKHFCEDNATWLTQYAYFCYFRDLYHTADFRQWPHFSTYDAKALQHYFAQDPNAADELQLYCYVQYELHRQLLTTKQVALSLGVILKGDIPIGICRNSDSAWCYPELFNFDGQAGAPPDDFAQDGQNWGFPTYAWKQHAATHYSWWRQRFAQLSTYFDAYRIDHVLGFFRIWEIPYGTHSGLLGHFSPAWGYTYDELLAWGFTLDANRHLQPHTTYHDLLVNIGLDNLDEVISCCFEHLDDDTFRFLPNLPNQSALCVLLDTKPHWSQATKHYLTSLFTEVLFVTDGIKKCYHPRIKADKTILFQTLTSEQQEAFKRLYQHYYYQRNDTLWQSEALKKIGALIDSSELLPCAEDLGMLPNGVRQTLDMLGILSLEIQTMPKVPWVQFADTSNYPYLSVATFATHDMPPLRNWWESNYQVAKDFYAQCLGHTDKAPITATPEVCEEVVRQHLESPSMLCLLAFQDWVSIDAQVRQADVTHEQINCPADPNHYWCYRMHCNVEELSANTTFCTHVRSLIERASR